MCTFAFEARREDAQRPPDADRAGPARRRAGPQGPRAAPSRSARPPSPRRAARRTRSSPAPRRSPRRPVTRISPRPGRSSSGCEVARPAEIEAEKQRAIAELRGEVADLALAGGRPVVGETMTDARQRRLVEEFLAETTTAASGSDRLMAGRGSHRPLGAMPRRRSSSPTRDDALDGWRRRTCDLAARDPRATRPARGLEQPGRPARRPRERSSTSCSASRVRGPVHQPASRLLVQRGRIERSAVSRDRVPAPRSTGSAASSRRSATSATAAHRAETEALGREVDADDRQTVDLGPRSIRR